MNKDQRYHATIHRRSMERLNERRRHKSVRVGTGRVNGKTQESPQMNQAGGLMLNLIHRVLSKKDYTHRRV